MNGNWAMTQTYADFDVQIRAVLGKVSIDGAEFAVATETVVSLVLKGCGVRSDAGKTLTEWRLP